MIICALQTITKHWVQHKDKIMLKPKSPCTDLLNYQHGQIDHTVYGPASCFEGLEDRVYGSALNTLSLKKDIVPFFYHK